MIHDDVRMSHRYNSLYEKFFLQFFHRVFFFHFSDDQRNYSTLVIINSLNIPNNYGTPFLTTFKYKINFEVNSVETLLSFDRQCVYSN